VNFFFYRPPILPPEKRYDDVLYKFTYNGRDYISHSRRLILPERSERIEGGEWMYSVDFADGSRYLYRSIELNPVGVFIDGVYFSRANV
jgi:hypothetical protein